MEEQQEIYEPEKNELSIVIDCISHLSTALRMDFDGREKGFHWEIRCAISKLENLHPELEVVEK